MQLYIKYDVNKVYKNKIARARAKCEVRVRVYK
jgi:hypothetical protein